MNADMIVTFFKEVFDGARTKYKDKQRAVILETLDDLASADGVIQADPLAATDEIMARLYGTNDN